jgi:2-dehydro-3-deoxyphosphooctonate aldolase (KDO 8-P synthase)
MKNVVEKILGNEVWITERGTSFGYNTLVVDYRGLVTMRETGCPIIFDATHSVQQPGALGGSSGGEKQFIEPLCRAALAVGVNGLFLETHNDPENAPSDAATQIKLSDLRPMLERLF